jgi:hypothetical protein
LADRVGVDVYERSFNPWSKERVGHFGESGPNAHLADLIDPDDPAFHEIMGEIASFMFSGVGLTEETVNMAVTIGRYKHKHKPAEDEPTPKPGQHAPVVYYIRRGAMVKIGTTVNMRARMAALLPEEILATEPGGYDLEAKRHREFRQFAVPGQREWFYAGKPLQDHVSTLRALHGPPPADLPTLVADDGTLKA